MIIIWCLNGIIFIALSITVNSVEWKIITLKYQCYYIQCLLLPVGKFLVYGVSYNLSGNYG